MGELPRPRSGPVAHLRRQGPLPAGRRAQGQGLGAPPDPRNRRTHHRRPRRSDGAVHGARQLRQRPGHRRPRAHRARGLRPDREPSRRGRARPRVRRAVPDRRHRLRLGHVSAPVPDRGVPPSRVRGAHCSREQRAPGQHGRGHRVGRGDLLRRRAPSPMRRSPGRSRPATPPTPRRTDPTSPSGSLRRRGCTKTSDSAEGSTRNSAATCSSMARAASRTMPRTSPTRAAPMPPAAICSRSTSPARSPTSRSSCRPTPRSRT